MIGTVVLRDEGNIVSQVQPLRASGFEWGYLGGGASDLARALLGEGVDPEVCAGFKHTVLAELQDDWRITAEDLRLFVERWPLLVVPRIGQGAPSQPAFVSREPGATATESLAA